jgi:uncharacterized protein (TIGR00269 family)
MKCRKCEQKAVVNMRQHKLALCGEHYTEWIPEQTQRFIDKYDMFSPEDRILVAVSGGKDSLALWEVLTLLGYRADGLYIGLGIDGGIGYSNQSLGCCVMFAEERGLNLKVFDVASRLGAPIPAAAQRVRRGQGRPCSVCGLSRRHIMNSEALDGGYDVLATGHNLDDEAATLFGNTLHWSVEHLSRQGPVLPAKDGLVRKAKPFCRLYERETAAYALLRGIKYVYDECPHAEGAKSIYYKQTLNKMEDERPGTKLQFYLSFLAAKQEGAFAPPPDLDSVRLHPCPSCGQPTSAPGSCAFCRTWEQVRDRAPQAG